MSGAVVFDPETSPVAVREMGLDLPCQANQGHKHNYDHVTLLLHGEAEVEIATEGNKQKKSVRLQHAPLRHQSNGIYYAAGLRLERMNVLDGDKWTLPNVKGHAILAVLQGTLELDDDKFAPGEYLQLRRGAIIERFSQTPFQAMHVSLDFEQHKETIHGDDFLFIAAEKMHNIKAKSKNLRYWCMFPHRDFSGIQVETYCASMGNQAAYD